MVTATATLTAQEEAIESGKKVLHRNVSDRVLRIFDAIRASYQPRVTRQRAIFFTESTYDWQAEEWSVPINATVSQVLKVGKLPVQVGAGVRYWADSPDNGPEGWSARLVVTFLLPE